MTRSVTFMQRLAASLVVMLLLVLGPGGAALGDSSTEVAAEWSLAERAAWDSPAPEGNSPPDPPADSCDADSLLRALPPRLAGVQVDRFSLPMVAPRAPPLAAPPGLRPPI